MEETEKTKIIAFKNGKPIYYIVYNDDMVSKEERYKVQKAIEKVLDVEETK